LGGSAPPHPSARPDDPWGPRYIILEVLAPPLMFSTFLGFSLKSGGHVWPRCGKDPTKGHFGRGLRRRDPYTTSGFEENLKNVENLKGGANTSGMMYRGPQGTPGRSGGERPRIKPVPVIWGIEPNKTPVLSSRLIRRLRLHFCAKLTQPGSATCCSGSRRVFPGVLWG
jgi:hypothetical protein